MNSFQNQRPLNALFGVFLTAVVAVAAVLLGSDLLTTPVSAVQISMIALAGTCDLVAASDGFGGWAWYRWSGLGSVLLGLSLPLGFVGTTWNSFVLLVTGLGGLSLVATGLDMFAFHGRYTRTTPLNQHD